MIYHRILNIPALTHAEAARIYANADAAAELVESEAARTDAPDASAYEAAVAAYIIVAEAANAEAARIVARR